MGFTWIVTTYSPGDSHPQVTCHAGHTKEKGERLAVLHVVEPDDIPDLLRKVKESGLPNLFIPRPEAFIRVDALPMLGTGKVDLRALKKIANEALGGSS